MDALTYQRAVMEGMLTAPGVDSESHAALGLTGEAGEVADLIKKSQYARSQPIDAEEMAKELGDCLWYLTFLCGYYGFTVEQIMDINIRKLAVRHPSVYSKFLPEALGTLFDPVY